MPEDWSVATVTQTKRSQGDSAQGENFTSSVGEKTNKI